MPTPTTTVTAAPNDAQDVADTEPLKAAVTASASPSSGKHAKAYTGSEKVATTAPRHAAKPTTKAGSRGPIKDAQGDGKVLDDIGKSVLPGGIGVHVPDVLLPFPGPGYTGRPEPVTPTSIDTQEDADNAPDTYNSDDVVSAPNVVTDPGKPWFHFPTGVPEVPTVTPEPVTEAPVSSTPVVITPVETPTTEPVRTGGLVTGTRPHWG
jgi:hypothetical protein